MPRITTERREVKRAEIVAAARRCFSRGGFHQTSMPDIAAAAGVSVGAPYRYFASKEAIILEIAGAAFRVILEPIERLLDGSDAPTIADLVEASAAPGSGAATIDAAGQPVPLGELLRCTVQAWAELLSHEGLRHEANRGFDQIRGRVAAALQRGQAAGTVPRGLDPDIGARVVMALLHGVVLQRAAFGLDDPDRFALEARTMLGAAGVLSTDRP